MAILDKFKRLNEEGEDLKKVVGLTDEKAEKQVTKKPTNEAKERKEQKEIKGGELPIEEFVEQFKKKYKDSKRQNHLLRIETDNYKKLIKLKVDKISLSEIVNFAVAYLINSEEYPKIIKTLKKE